ncbi:MAG: sensor histidine kinase, partial [Bacteroidales bacterium]|nr:sensor histidine kinase [Bacteroidales bacterium]
MKLQARYLFVIKIAAIVLLALAGAWLMLKGLYFSAILVLVVIVSLAVSVYLDRRKLISRMERMISSIQNSDFSFHLPETTTKDELHNLSAEMEEALQAFRRQTQSSFMDEAETQAWQKLISVLTHEIMNSIAPIISLSETLSDTAETPALPTEDEYKNMQQAMRIIHRRSKGLLSFVENYRKLTKIPE